MARHKLTINGIQHEIDVPGEMPLLWVLRDVIGLTGTKYGCGVAQCGACTVHVDGRAVRSCVTPVASVAGKAITTIEGLPAETHPLHEAWVAESVPQCGYCQPGQIMTAAALLKSKPKPQDGDLDVALNGNLCVCGCYPRIKRAIKRAAGVA